MIIPARQITIKRILWALIVLFFLNNEVLTQSYQTFNSELQGIIKNTKFKFGPFRLFPSFRIRDVGYDDNVYYSREADEPISDYTATLSPEVKGYILFRNYLILSFTETPEYLFYFKQTGERGWNHSFSPQARLLLFNRFVVSGSYQYRNRKIRTTSEFGARVRSIDKGYKASLFYETARSTSIGVTLSTNKVSYEDIFLPEENIRLAAALNRQENQGDFEFYYRIFSESFLFFKGSYTEHNFESGSSSWKDASSYTFSSGLRFPETGRLTGQFVLGYKKLVPKDKNRSGYTGMIGSTGIELQIRRFRFRIDYQRDSRFSFWSSNFYFLENSLRSGISFYVTSFLKLSYDFRYGENLYPEPVWLQLDDGSLIELDRKDIHQTHTFGFIVRIIRKTGIGLTMDLWDRSSNLYWAGRGRVFVGVSITHDF